MRRFALALPVLALALFLVPAAKSFFDELAELKQELVVWQTTHASDFSDLLNTLDDLSGPSFSDVSDADWFSPYVASVSDWGIVSGYKDAQGNPTGVFGPANAVTVAEMLKMAAEAAQVDEDVCGVAPSTHAQAAGHWAAKYIACAEQMKVRILEDASDINRQAKRAEVLAIMDDIFKDSVPPLFSNFRDTAGHPLEADIAFGYLRGIVSGDKDSRGTELGTFRPDASINRAEVAKIIYQRLKVDVNEGE
jgi:hypothetical protein